jgi:hypothetical protein
MSEGFRGVPGVPDGWELVAIRKVRYMESYIWTSGYSSLWQDSEESDFIVPVIRKIEKPAKYRPFANAKEYRPHFDKAIKPKAVATMEMLVIKYSQEFVFFVSGSTLNSSSYENAFYGVEFADGTPFGVKIDE